MYVLESKNIYKQFGKVEVLKNITFQLKRGEVHALLGANGAGKSTLIKIICGAYSATRGQIMRDGQEVQPRKYARSSDYGVSVIYQELSLVPTLTVLQNIFLGKEVAQRGFLLKEKAMRAEYDALCESMDFYIDPTVLVGDLTIAQQQMVEIMKAISNNAEVVIMDEPTTSLTETEKRGLFKMIDKLKQAGKSVIYVSHILDEVLEICDNASIMRNGEMVGTYPISELDKGIIANHMTGEDQTIISAERHSFARYDEVPTIEMREITVAGVLKEIDLKVFPGEVVGLAGLVGSKRTELTEVLYGMRLPDSGEIRLNGEPARIRNSQEAIKHQIGLIPEDRKHLGLNLSQAIYKNMTAVQLKKFTEKGILQHGEELAFSKDKQKRLGIKLHSLNQEVGELSGGNQQKVVIAKWIDQELKALIYDEPTKGIDIAAKEDVFGSITDFAQQGVSIIFISSDLEEVIRVSDRIYVMNNGEIINELVNQGIEVKDLVSEVFKVERSEVV